MEPTPSTTMDQKGVSMIWHYIGILMVVTGSIYALPQVIRSIQRGNSKGISAWFIAFWLFDKLVSLVYVSHLGDAPLMIKYSIGFIFILIIAFYKRID